MSLDTRALVAELTADLCLDRISGRRVLGVFVEHMPALDPGVFVDRIANGAKRPLRVALLGAKRLDVKGPPSVTLSESPSEANRWRNDEAARRGMPFITVVLGPTAKLNSLRSAVSLLGPGDLRQAAVRRAIALLDTPERGAFWNTLGRRPEFPTQILLSYLAKVSATARKSQAALLEAEPACLHVLGLLQQDGLLSAKGTRSVSTMIGRNLDLVVKLRAIPTRERSRVVRIAEQETSSSPESRARCWSLSGRGRSSDSSS